MNEINNRHKSHPKFQHKYWKGKAFGRGGVGSGGNPQVRRLSHQNGKRPPFLNQNSGGQQRPVKMLDESIAKRKALSWVGDHFACFMCGSPKHIAPYCKAYPHQKPTSKPCKCRLYNLRRFAKPNRAVANYLEKL